VPAINVWFDEDTHPAIAEALRHRGWEALTVADTGLYGASDEVQLSFATERGYSIFTYNQGDFVQLHTRWMEEGRPHTGILIGVQEKDPRRMIRALFTFLSLHEAAELENMLAFVNNWA
jgi:predicted nuclease of predicted toxin-antitoxin system